MTGIFQILLAGQGAPTILADYLVIAGGGGGGGNGGSGAGGNGGSGIVILQYLGSQKGTGGVVTTVGSYTVHTFTTSGTFVA